MLFKSYLSERTQKVKLFGYNSEEASITFGVSQGSVLGPTLFLIYMNDLCSIKIVNAIILSYADDTAIIFAGESWEAVRHSAETGLAQVAQWLQHNLLTLNASKTNFLCFSMYNNSQPQSDFSLKIHGCKYNKGNTCDCPKINRVPQTKYLGITVDQRLSWYPQLDHVISRIRKLIWIFKTLRHVIPLSTNSKDPGNHLLNQIYISLVQSIITYLPTAFLFGVVLLRPNSLT